MDRLWTPTSLPAGGAIAFWGTVTRSKIVEIEVLSDPAGLSQLKLAVLND